MKRQKINHCGSAVIEMTLLIPVFLGCIYFYIMLFLYLVQTTKQFYFLAENLYETESVTASGEGIEKTVKGKKETVMFHEKDSFFEIRIQMSRDHSDVIENIRRWQLATSGI